MGVTGIVLAAGASRRMGEPKLLLPYEGGTVLGGTVQALARSTVDQIIVVTGPHDQVIEATLGDAGITAVKNPDPSRGNMSSLLTATDADDAEAFILVAGDLPTMRSAVIDTLVDLWDRKAPWAAVTTYTDRIAHPFLLSRDAIDEYRSCQGSKVLWRALVASADPRVIQVPRADLAPLDVNTPEDYERLKESGHS